MSDYLHWTVSGWDVLGCIVCVAMLPVMAIYDHWPQR